MERKRCSLCENDEIECPDCWRESVKGLVPERKDQDKIKEHFDAKFDEVFRS